ncbi:MAG TPA: YbhB/YbcL family Raf kinase inhibitor-like protein [Bacteroidia bacterium]|jgi:Raf kinase inhibitor-like YbhB/YbcL family protein|nr:YbhB/YbcL family Raf kinase inhibitor-like protein [Bacteroidia bacterium]
MTTTEKVKALKVSSSAFEERSFIPRQYTRDGDNCNPPLKIDAIPEGTKSFALIVEDPDAPGKDPFVHWLMWNIPPVHSIDENSAPGEAGKNDFGNARYDGPAPPSGAHHYFFHLYALDAMIKLKPGTGKAKLMSAIQPHVIGEGTLVGVYRRAL